MTNAVKHPRIYLAGPEVFLPNALEIGRTKAARAAAAGFEGRFPLDQSLSLDGLTNTEKAMRIYVADRDMMHACDLIIANLTPFRGVSMDSGTAFEIGYMRALGKPIFGYTNASADYRTRAEAFRARGIPHGDFDRIDVMIEDFGLSENLMIEQAVIECGAHVVRTAVAPGTEMTDLTGFERCLEQARAHFGLNRDDS
jgi:nucleoside 2-deoxyribosyltransferase